MLTTLPRIKSSVFFIIVFNIFGVNGFQWLKMILIHIKGQKTQKSLRKCHRTPRFICLNSHNFCKSFLIKSISFISIDFRVKFFEPSFSEVSFLLFLKQFSIMSNLKVDKGKIRSHKIYFNGFKVLKFYDFRASSHHRFARLPSKANILIFRVGL